MIKNHTGETIDNQRDLDYVNLSMRLAVLPVTVLIGIENVIGLVGNILILLVYSKRYEKSNFRYFVLFMALIDLTSCLTCVPGEVFSQLNWYKNEHAWICKVKSYFNVLGAWGSASILLLLAFDRHRKICRPLGWQIQPSLALKLCSAAVIVSACVSSPITVLWGKQTYLYEKDDIRVNVSVCEKSSEFTENTIYPFLYITCVYILPVGLMMVVITTLNILTAKKLFCERDQRLTETFTITTMSRTNNFSQASISTISETLTTLDEVDANVSQEIISTTNHCTQNNSPPDRPTSRRLSAELTTLNDEGKTTSVTFVTLNDITIETENTTRAPNEPNESKTSSTKNENVIKQSRRLSSIKISASTSLRPASLSSSNKCERREELDSRVKKKTIIMLVLTTVFVITMSLYVILISVIAEQNILQELTNSEKAVYFLFFRLYFINCVINPFLYGFMDPRFRTGVKNIFFKNSFKK